MTKTYNIEITDTFGGDTNYSWVRRYQFSANSIRGAVQKLAREYGAGWRFDHDDGNTARFNLKNACICMFVTESEG
jgi:hypothetical protein